LINHFLFRYILGKHPKDVRRSENRTYRNHEPPIRRPSYVPVGANRYLATSKIKFWFREINSFYERKHQQTLFEELLDPYLFQKFE